MLSCREAETLIVEAADRDAGGVDAGLATHLERCDTCRERLEANRAVRQMLMTRPVSPVPGGFAAKVLDRVNGRTDEPWLRWIDWQRWTRWMLPVTAMLILGAGVSSWMADSSVRTTAGEVVSSVGQVASTTDDVVVALEQDVSSDELIARMLGRGEQ
jgi:hypothetical protein